MTEPAATFAFRAHVELGPVQTIGRVARGLRRIVPITGGTFEGPDLSGRILPFGADWQLIHDNGYMELDARYTLETDRGELIYVNNAGFRHGPAELAARFGRGETVDMSGFRHGLRALLETGAPRLDWMNYRIFSPTARRQPSAMILEFYAIG